MDFGLCKASNLSKLLNMGLGLDVHISKTILRSVAPVAMFLAFGQLGCHQKTPSFAIVSTPSVPK